MILNFPPTKLNYCICIGVSHLVGHQTADVVGAHSSGLYL